MESIEGRIPVREVASWKRYDKSRAAIVEERYQDEPQPLSPVMHGIIQREAAYASEPVVTRHGGEVVAVRTYQLTQRDLTMIEYEVTSYYGLE